MGLLLLFILGGAAAVYVVSRATGSSFGDQYGSYNDLLKVFDTPAGAERFEDPIYSTFGSSIAPEAVSTGTYEPSKIPGVPDLWKVAGAGPNMEPPTGLAPYTIVPNNYGVGGEMWMGMWGSFTPWPMADQFPFRAKNQIGVDDFAWGVGYEYLASAPNTATARVAAMRAKVDAYTATRGGAKPGFLTSQMTPLDFIAKASWGKMSEAAGAVVKSLGDASKFGEIAQAVGVSESDVQDLAAQVLDKAKGGLSNTAIVSEAAKYVRPVADAIDQVMQSAISGESTEVVALEAVKAVAQWIPVYGQYVTIAAGLIEGKLQADEAAAAEACRATVTSINNAQRTAIDGKLPIPWHASVDFSATTCSGGGNATPDQYALEQIYTYNLSFIGGQTEGEGLNIEDKIFVQRWWAAASMFMSDTRIYDIFNALGNDIYGGTVASDEQVMLVAAPIALANGITDIDEFTKRLWCRSQGWLSASNASFVNEGFDVAAVGTMTRNAWWLQWAALARDAFQLADELKGRTDPTSILGDPATLTHLIVSASVIRPTDMGGGYLTTLKS